MTCGSRCLAIRERGWCTSREPISEGTLFWHPATGTHISHPEAPSRHELYVNNLVEQGHHGVKRITRPMLGFKSFDAAQCTLTGVELMHMLRKGQRGAGAEQSLTPAAQFYALAA
jgi:transposase-like protein